MLFVGTRGGRVADTVAPLAGFADVVLASSADLLGQRSDLSTVTAAGRAGGAGPGWGAALAAEVGAAAAVVAPSREDLLVAAGKYAAEHRVDGVLTFSDDLVEPVAAFAAELGLPGQPVHTIANFRDKSAQRAALAAAGLPVPANVEITDPGQAAAALAAVPLPAILKPTRGSGGALAFVVNRPQELAPLLAEVFAAARAAGGTGGAVEEGTAFILESLIVGSRWHEVDGIAPYVSVESVAVGGRYHHLAVTDRFPLAPPVLETGMLFPSTLRGDQQATITEATTAALRALGFEHGLAHTELMLTADGPVVIEVNARAGGALPYLFPMASDVDLIALAGRVALGEPPVAAPTFRGHAVFVMPQHPLGVQVTAVTGLDEVRALDRVHVVIPMSLAGSRTDSFQHTVIAVVLGTATAGEQAVSLYRQVMAAVRGEYAPAEAPAHYRRCPGSPS
jgi:hypothetical protein